MKRVSVLLIMAMVAIWAVPVGMNGAQRMADQPLQYQMRWDSNALASVSRTGNNHQSVAFMTRTVSGQTFQVLNSYSSPSQHVGQIDLTEYLIPGWSLDNVTMDVGFYYMANAAGRLTGTVLSGYLYQVGGLTGCLWVSVGFILIASIVTRYLPEKNLPGMST